MVHHGYAACAPRTYVTELQDELNKINVNTGITLRYDYISVSLLF